LVLELFKCIKSSLNSLKKTGLIVENIEFIPETDKVRWKFLLIHLRFFELKKEPLKKFCQKLVKLALISIFKTLGFDHEKLIYLKLKYVNYILGEYQKV
jgi:hypothetical protein